MRFVGNVMEGVLNLMNDIEKILNGGEDKTLKELKKEYKLKQKCYYCKRKMVIGSIGGFEEKWGCYKVDCPIKKKHSKYDYYSIDLHGLSDRIYKFKENKKLAEAIEQYVIKARIEELSGFNCSNCNYEIEERIAELKKGLNEK